MAQRRRNTFVNQPNEHLGRAVAGIADQLAQPDAEIVSNALDYACSP